MIFLVGLLLGVFLGFYFGNKDFRQKLNKGVGSLFKKIVDSQGSDDKKKVVKK
jgi:hypothetical protein